MVRLSLSSSLEIQGLLFAVVIECPDGTFGTFCLEMCSCITERVGSPQCDIVNGTCNCLPGYFGVSCEEGMIFMELAYLQLLNLALRLSF